MPEFNIVERIKNIDKKQLFLLFLIFVLAFGVRAHLFKYEYLFGFDSYYHARMAGTLIENGSLPQVDELSYYFMETGGGSLPQNTFFWHFSAVIYTIATLGTGYNKVLWIQFVKALPALFGALTCVAMFFLGKDLYDRRAGYVMAFMASVVPSYVYRTLAGFFEEDSLGFLWLVIGMVFFVRAVKDPVFNRKGIMNAVLAGIFFGVMSITWDMFLLVPLVLGLYFFFAVAKIYFEQGLKKFLDFLKLFAITSVIFGAMATANYGTGWITRALGYATESVSKSATSLSLPPGAGVTLLIAAFVLLAAFVLYIGYSNRSEEKRKSGAKTVSIITVILLYCAVIAIAITFMTIPALFEETSVLGKTVGEENTGKQFFGIKYNALIVFPVLALLLIPVRMLRNKKDHLSLMIFFWILITYFMAWYKLKFTYTFGLPIAAAAGIITVELFYYLKARTHLEQKTIAVALGFMLLVGIASAAIFVPDKIPHIEQPHPDWKGALHWVADAENVPEDAKMFNWWDEGHWISFLGERAVSADNRNASWESNMDFGLFVVSSDSEKSLEIARKYDFDYVILSSDMFMKISSFANYAYDTTNNGDPRILPFLIAPRAAIPCSLSGDNHVCGPNQIPVSQMGTIPAKWSETSNQMHTAENGVTVPLYVYRAEDNSELYITNPAVNESMLGKLWFNESGVMEHFEEVYSHAGIRIFRAIK